MTINRGSLIFFIHLLLLLPGFSQGQIQLSVDLEDQNFHPGVHEFQALDSITMTNVTLDSGAALNLRCHEEIVLYPGVNISQGVYLETILGVAVSEVYNSAMFYIKEGEVDLAIGLLKWILD